MFSLDVSDIQEILLADRWHVVDAGTFDIDEMQHTRTVDGQRREVGHISDVGPPLWFRFQEDGVTITGPMASIIATRDSGPPASLT